ncbi:MAG: hypothetical protein RIT28_1865 [Pseudomonadota bacterium]|jgi:acyl carrier protein
MRVALNDVADRIIHHVENGLDRPVNGPVTVRSHLAQDLQLDSMESVALLAELEDHYGVTMPVQVFQRAQTLGDVAEAVVEVLERHGGQGT